MAESVALREEDVGRIGEYLKPWVRELVEGMVPRDDVGGIGTQLLERSVRVEEELKTQRELLLSQRELMDERFGFTKERFAAIDKRFEAVDRRFDEVIAQSNRRFDDAIANSDKRFKAVIWMIGFGVALTTSLTTVFGLLA